LAKEIQLPRAALETHPHRGALVSFEQPTEILKTAFIDPDPFVEFTFPDRVAAKLAIASELGKPLAKLAQEQQDFIYQIVAETLNKRQLFEQVALFLIHHP
jgi:hypothetical protein